jgi:DNA-binding HxlR family transcriptional regulator
MQTKTELKKQLPDQEIPATEEICPMPDIAKLIGGKWKLIILQILIFKGMKRFNELRRQIGAISQTMLTNQLRSLENDGFVNRKIYAEVPPRVEYSATQRARDLEAVFLAMHKWWLNDESS